MGEWRCSMVLVFLWVFVLSLAALVVLELIIPSGAVPGPIEAVQGIRLWVRRNRRYLFGMVIIRVLV